MRETPHGVYFGDLFGFPLFAHRTLLAAAPMLAFLVFIAGSSGDLIDRLLVLVFLLFSVLAHELAHAFAGRALGVPVKHIALAWFGGYAEFWMRPARRWQEITIALAGPLTNLAIGGGALLLARLLFPDAEQGWMEGGYLVIPAASEKTLLENAVRTLGWVNVGLGLFNLLPGLPLDGGHVLRSVLSVFTSLRRAHAVAAFAGFLVGLGAIAYAVHVESLWMVLIGVTVMASGWHDLHSA